jgi:hypothetical protein
MNGRKMKKTRVIKILKILHKWPAIIIAFIAILFASSGIVMNHRKTFSPIDIPRHLLPGNYAYKNWNLAAVRGSFQAENEQFIYGNIGIWKSTDDFKSFNDFNQGFPKGIDSRKIYSVIEYKNQLFAGTHLGLYKRESANSIWIKIKLPVEKERITDLEIKDNSLLILTRHYLLESSDGTNFQVIQLPQPVNYQRKAGLFNTFWELHSGELFGIIGKLIVDLLGIITIILSITGLLHFFLPKIIRRKKSKEKNVTKLVNTKKKNLRWHNITGYIFFVFLIVNTFSGMHLRPPLLIAIANKEVGIIPGTHMDSPNPWFDKLRRVHWDKTNRQYIFSTSDGFYFADENLRNELIPAQGQPPVSVMGCNVLESLGGNNFMVGSFSGMFIWNINTGMVADYFTGQPYQPSGAMDRPFADNTVAGFVKSVNNSWWFDFSRGAIDMDRKPSPTSEAFSSFPSMPEKILEASPMSLWNVSLEIHTGRIFEHLIGGFYILFVPLAGICIMLVLISGFFIWWLVYQKKKQN